MNDEWEGERPLLLGRKWVCTHWVNGILHECGKYHWFKWTAKLHIWWRKQ